MPDAGRVYLVGAGPGDPGLLTARALELIAAADVILHDRLIPVEALAGAREDAERLFVGKEGGGPSVPQQETEALMVDRARSGATVVRLKGGDPFVFGRGGEEALTLVQEGIEFEVVPGVTAGVAATAYAGIPVTHRGLARGVALVTGHTREDDEATEGEEGLDWEALARFPGTLVVYMAVSRLALIAQSLIAAGRSENEPCAVIERGTLPGQRTVSGTLATIAERAVAESVKAPSITVVGPVTALADELAWRSDGPLAGRTVAVTRARAQASELGRRLRELGARVIEGPTIRINALEVPALDLAPYDLICLTSANAVQALFEQLARSESGPRDARALAGARVAAIGAATSRALAEHGITADIVPERAVAESLVEALAPLRIERALIARAKEAREVIERALQDRGVPVDVVALYETLSEPLDPATLDAVLGADYITFTSSSTVRNLLASAGGARPNPETRIVSIGPITSATLREEALRVDREAEQHDVDGLIAAILADLHGP